MRNFIIATHGNFATGIKSSLDIIYGKTDNIFCICAYMDEEVNIDTQIKEALSKVDSDNTTIVITDIFGGSVNNEFLPYIDSHSIHLIAGLNLPMLIELVAGSKYIEDTEALIKNAIEASTTTIQYCNETIKIFSSVEDEF